MAPAAWCHPLCPPRGAGGGSGPGQAGAASGGGGGSGGGSREGARLHPGAEPPVAVGATARAVIFPPAPPLPAAARRRRRGLPGGRRPTDGPRSPPAAPGCAPGSGRRSAFCSNPLHCLLRTRKRPSLCFLLCRLFPRRCVLHGAAASSKTVRLALLLSTTVLTPYRPQRSVPFLFLTVWFPAGDPHLQSP